MPTNSVQSSETEGASVSRGIARDRIGSYRWLLLLAAICLLIDQATKAVIRNTLPFGTYFLDGATVEPVAVIEGTFYLVHIGNHGAAWGILGGKSLLLAALALVVLIWIYIQRKAIGLQRNALQIYFGFLVGGILGNFVDRIRLRYVTDFLDVHLPTIPLIGFPGYRWPAFNFADSFIFTGVSLYLIHTFFFEDSGKAARPPRLS